MNQNQDENKKIKNNPNSTVVCCCVIRRVVCQFSTGVKFPSSLIAILLPHRIEVS